MSNRWLDPGRLDTSRGSRFMLADDGVVPVVHEDETASGRAAESAATAAEDRAARRERLPLVKASLQAHPERSDAPAPLESAVDRRAS